MDELFEKTKDFLVEFEKILNKEFETNKPTTFAEHEEYDYVGELDYLFNELWEKESDNYLFGAGHQYENIRHCELKELTDKGIYFPFCKFKVYEKTYKERLSKFQEIYEDAEEIDFIENELPEGYETVVGERGVRLSGGQRQRIGIARSLYHDPDVLVLDEATSSLDVDTEREIMGTINKLHGSKTLIIIAHRLSTVQHCDRIYRMENGRIIGEGDAYSILGEEVAEVVQ